MNALCHADHPRIEAEMPTELLADLLMEAARKPAVARTEKLSPKIYCVMAMTTLLTFATLTTGYQMLFAHHPFA